MKVLLVGSLASSLRNFRGPLVVAIREAGHDVHVAAPGLLSDAATRTWLEAQGMVCHDIFLDRAGLNPVSDLRTALNLRKLMLNVRPDLFMGYTAKPVIWGLIAAGSVGITKRVALVTGLGYAFTDGAGGVRATLRSLTRALYRFALRRATLIFFQNADDGADFQRLGLLPQETRVEIVSGSGVDVAHYLPVPLPTSPTRFTLIARLLGDKGIREFVAAARQVKQNRPGVTFHLVGGVDSNPAAIPWAEVQSWHDAGHIHWHGHLDDVRPILAQTHVYVLPSYREGTPRTVLEAMSMGRPIITTDAPGCRETVKHGDNGYLVPVKAVDELVKAMERFILEPDLINQMGIRSREIAVEKYDVHKVNEQMLECMGIITAKGLI